MIAVAGATGTIGSELVELLVGAGAEVTALVRDRGRAHDRLGPDVSVHEVDMRDPATLRPGLEGVESLFLVSNDPTLEPAVVNAAVAAGVRRIVKSSAIGFGEDPPAGHAEAERHVMTSGTAWTVLRPNAFMQTLAGYLPVITTHDGVFELPGGDGRTAFVDTRDIAGVAAAVLLGPHLENAVHLVTGPEALSMADVAAIVATTTGRRLVYRPVSMQQAQQCLRERGVGPMAEFLTSHYRSVAAGGFETITDTVQRITGRPARSLTAFVAEDTSRWTPPAAETARWTAVT